MSKISRLIVLARADIPTTPIKTGDVYYARRYPFHQEKIMLIKRVQDGYDPCVTTHINNVKIIGKEL